jgi:hypothetical protein
MSNLHEEDFDDDNLEPDDENLESDSEFDDPEAFDELEFEEDEEEED